jgi:hypothetical protein
MNDDWSKFIHVKSPKFAPLPGEDDEIVNPGTYGKALSLYIQEKLAAKGHSVPFVCAEDWGWWVELKDSPVKGGVAVYCGPATNGGYDFACLLGFSGAKKWSWKKFGSLDLTAYLAGLFNDLLTTFQDDPEVEVVGVTEECPVGEDVEE